MMQIRELRREDSALLVDLHARMSTTSRYRRFHAAVPTLTHSMLSVLLDVDETDHVALVATIGGTAIGIARLIRNPRRPQEAEVAVAVVDDWHRRGVGRVLIQALIRRADVLGIHRVRARILMENTAALALFRSMFPLSLARHDDGVVEMEGLLDVDQLSELTMDEVLSELLS